MVAKKLRRSNKKRLKTKKKVKKIINSILNEVDELVNETDYFNIYKISTEEINFLIDLNVENVKLLNQLHAEKVIQDDLYTKIYIRRNKIPELENWVLYNDGTEKFLVSELMLADIRNNISQQFYSNQHIIKYYIKNKLNPIDTIIYIMNPDILKKTENKYTEEQIIHNNIRKLLDEKNEIFNNRMKKKPSITKFKDIIQKNNSKQGVLDI